MPVSPPLALVEPPQQLWRVERDDSPLRFSRINAVDAVLDRSGNRFDVAGAGVLYAATDQEGAYAETLAAFRPSASLIAKLEAAGMDPGLPGPGEVPRSWRLDRRLRALTLSNPLPFVDIDAPSTHSNTGSAAVTLTFKSLQYVRHTQTQVLRPGQHKKLSWPGLNGWYDVEISTAEDATFRRRLTGRVEDGDAGITG